MATQQNSISQHHGPTMKDYILAARPQFLVASMLPVILGTVVGYQYIVASGGNLDLLAFILSMVCVMFVNLGINVLNDVYDDVIGTDRINKHAFIPFTGGSRVIQDKLISQQQMRQWSYVLLTLAIVTGFILFLYKGYVVLLFGLAGMFLGVAYSAPPLQLASRGLGELTIALGCGLIPVMGAAWLQSGGIGWAALLLSLSVGIWVANIVVVNEVPDAQADAKSGKRTLGVRFGDKATAGLYLIGNLVAASMLLIAAISSLVPYMAIALPVLFLLPQIYVTDKIRQWHKDRQAYALAIKINILGFVLGLLWLSIWIMIG